MSEPKTPQPVRCGKCAHTWVGFYTPISLGAGAKMLKSLHCPMCGADSKDIFLDVNSVTFQCEPGQKGGAA